MFRIFLNRKKILVIATAVICPELMNFKLKFQVKPNSRMRRRRITTRLKSICWKKIRSFILCVQWIFRLFIALKRRSLSESHVNKWKSNLLCLQKKNAWCNNKKEKKNSFVRKIRVFLFFGLKPFKFEYERFKASFQNKPHAWMKIKSQLENCIK